MDETRAYQRAYRQRVKDEIAAGLREKPIPGQRSRPTRGTRTEQPCIVTESGHVLFAVPRDPILQMPAPRKEP
ncbi:MAG: hypothetical protein ACYCOR_21700 [Acidobacteriaceae bacterium]